MRLASERGVAADVLLGDLIAREVVEGEGPSAPT